MEEKRTTKIKNIILWWISIMLILYTLIYIGDATPQAICFGILAVLLMPPVNNKINEKFIKENRKNKKAIYLDEIWRLIGVTSNKNVAGFVYKIFKTIRKYGGSAVAITQDISDLFSLEEGNFGKSILNNTSIKNFFSLEEENIKVLKKYTNISEKEEIDIKSLRRGETLMFVGENHILAEVKSFNYEDDIINNEEEKNEN